MNIKQLSKSIVKKIMDDLDDRNLGLDSVDEDIRKEIKNELQDIVIAVITDSIDPKTE